MGTARIRLIHVVSILNEEVNQGQIVSVLSKERLRLLLDFLRTPVPEVVDPFDADASNETVIDESACIQKVVFDNWINCMSFVEQKQKPLPFLSFRVN